MAHQGGGTGREGRRATPRLDDTGGLNGWSNCCGQLGMHQRWEVGADEASQRVEERERRAPVPVNSPA